MDPFTQRMLERAKVRREKLDSQKMELQQTNILQESSNICHKRKPLEVVPEKKTNVDCASEKECLSRARKSKLQKLAQFYSGDDENVFVKDVEIKEDYSEIEDKKQQLKLGRLTKLASKIREWDDDDVVAVKKSANVEKSVSSESVKKKECEVTKKSSEKSSWDANLVKNLGFALKESESKLVYDFPKSKTDADVLKSKGKTCVASEGDAKGENVDVEKKENKVLKQAALFEKSTKEEPNTRVKDPVEMSVAERKAIFEKNLNDAVFPSSYYHKKPVQSYDHQKVSFQVKDKEREANLSCKTSVEREKSEDKKLLSGGEEEEKKNKVTVSSSREVAPAPSSSSSSAPSPATSPAPSPAPSPSLPPLPMIHERIKKESIFEKSVNDSKNGRLYPSLSNLDISETNDSTFSEQNESKNSNFYLNMTLSDLMEINKDNPCTPPSENSFSKSKECQVLNKMDKLLENALNELSTDEDEDEDEEDETGSEKVYNSPPEMIKSSSFEYSRSSGERSENNLLHTVSFYRKQQNSIQSSSPSVQDKEESIGDYSLESEENESVLVEKKIDELLTEVSKQQTIISQASQALNLCLSTVEFSGSEEQVEGERLLLLATHKRQACLNEIQRLKVENSLRPQEVKLLTEKGDVNLSNISIKLKRDALRAIAAAENHLYFVCLIKSDEQVLATPVASVSRENLKDLALSFPGQVKLESLLSNFKITVEVYSLELNKECLPHNVKYHIANKKEKKLLTPIKTKKSESKLVKPYIQSPAGPNAVRTSNFQMCGYVVFSLKEVTRTQWTLNKVPYISPLEGTLSMSIKSQLRLEDEFRGFLTMFDDISGFGAWHRRWCLLSSHFISYWKYPDDEHKKVPIGTIDLRSVVTENIGIVSRDVCARLNTFLLETTRPRLSDDKNSLVLSVNGDITTIRHLLSADSKQEMLLWCKKLNTTLALLRSWKCNIKE